MYFIPSLTSGVLGEVEERMEVADTFYRLVCVQECMLLRVFGRCLYAFRSFPLQWSLGRNKGEKGGGWVLVWVGTSASGKCGVSVELCMHFPSSSVLGDGRGNIRLPSPAVL